MTLGEFRSRINSFFANESPATAVANYIDGCINRAYETVVRTADQAHWLRRSFSFNTMARVSTTGSTGISAATGGSAVVTMGSGLRLDRRHIGGYLRIGGQQETYLIKDVSRGGAYPGAGSVFAIIDPPYSGVAFGTAETAKDVEYMQINYRLPPDFINTYSVKQNATPMRLWAMEPMGLDRWVANPLILGQRGTPYIYLLAHGGFLPDFWGTKTINALDLGSGAFVGTVTFTNDSVRVEEGAFSSGGFGHNLVLSADSTLDADRLARNLLQGQFIRMTGDPRWYRVADIRDTNTGVADSPLRLLLEEPFKGATTTGANFTVNGSDSSTWIRLYPVPDSAIHIDIEYHAMPPILQTANEEPRLPGQLHGVILAGALMEMCRYMNDQRAIIYEREFDSGLERVRRAQGTMTDKVNRYEAVPSFDGAGRVDFTGILPSSIQTGS